VTHRFIKVIPFVAVLVTWGLFGLWAASFFDESHHTNEEASDEIPLPEWLLEKPFRAVYRVTYNLDGSSDAGDFSRRSEIRDEVVYVDHHNWRARRELPFSGNIRELLMTDQSLYWMKPNGKSVPARELSKPSTWVEILMAPYELAKEWGLISYDDNWDKWLTKLRSRKRGLFNTRKDLMMITNEDQNVLRIAGEGTVLFEGKIQVRITAQWQLSKPGTITSADLHHSLIRSY